MKYYSGCKKSAIISRKEMLGELRWFSKGSQSKYKYLTEIIILLWDVYDTKKRGMSTSWFRLQCGLPEFEQMYINNLNNSSVAYALKTLQLSLC